MSGDTSANLVDFSAPTQVWIRVNDGVMGGLSQSSMKATKDGTGLFTGKLSLENNGGFASVRTALEREDWSSFDGLTLHLRGDGREYQVRFRTDLEFDGVAYRYVFETVQDEWTTVTIPFSEFEPVFRGRVLKNEPPLDRERLRQLSLMVADKTAGPFSLEVSSISAYRHE